MGRLKGDSLYSPYKEKIINLLDEGYTIKCIFRMLFPVQDSGYNYSTFLQYVNRNGLRYVTENAGYEKLPVCSECENCMDVKRYENGMKNISVCYIEKREIRPYSIASPRWCPNRDKKRQGEV